MSLRSFLVRQFLSTSCPRCGAFLTCLRSTKVYSSTFPPSPPRRVVVVRKTTRLEYERMKNHLSEQELRNRLSRLGSDYENLLQRDSRHNKSVDIITNYLKSHGVETRLRDRETYSEDDVSWGDMIISAGGDGSFLCTASRVLLPSKLVVGLNTDPNSSEGYLCLGPSRYGSLGGSMDAIFQGKTSPFYRTRIRMEVDGELLPVRSLNEVFIGEKNPSHASYYELSCEGHFREKQKSSGLLIYTGTGSTSWAYNANRVTTSEVEKMIRLLQGDQTQTMDTTRVSQVTEAYNSGNVFAGDEKTLAFVVREPIVRGIFAACHTHGKAPSLTVKSLSWNTELMVDGQFQYELRRGAVVKCWLHPQDTLTTLT